ncbi:MAG: hypothetical protein H0V66_16335 [Bdellovibrionales bacterium]|nr:hypothetical protein [Bdellovibrionales bacterium]
MDQIINFDSWPRKHHFEAFMGMDSPHLSIAFTVNVMPLIKKKEINLFSTLLFLIHQTCQEIPEFHYRLLYDGSVVNYHQLDLSFNILAEDGLFSNHRMTPAQDYDVFRKDVQLAIEMKNKEGKIEIDPNQKQNMILTSFLPWITFTGLREPTFNKFDSIPRITWGNYSGNGDLPISITAHHGFIDGSHIGQFYSSLNHKLSLCISDGAV